MRGAVPSLLVAAGLAGCVTTRPPFQCETNGGRPWVAVTSPAFAVVTDLDEDDARALAIELAEIRDGVSSSLFQRRHDPPVRVTVIAFRSGADYRGFAPPGAAAYYARGTADPKIVMPGRMDFEQRRLLAHEMAHHVSSYVLLRMPRWLSEGIATWAETVGTTYAGTRMTTGGVPPGRRLLVRPQRIPAAQLLAWSGSVPPGELGPYYDAAWLLFHFLVGQYPEELSAFEARLAGAEDPDAAFREVFPQWSPSTPGGPERLDAELDSWARLGRFEARPVRAGPPPEITVQHLPSAEVHAIRMLLWSAGTATAGDDAAVRAELDEGLRESPDHPVLLRELAQREGRPPLPLARRSVKAHPGDPRAWTFLAESLPPDALEEREEALRKAMGLAPRNPVVLTALADVLLRAGRSGEALPYARQAVQMAPFSPPALDVYAAVTADLGNCQQSVLASRRALDVLPDEATAESRQYLQARLDEHVARCVPSGR